MTSADSSAAKSVVVPPRSLRGFAFNERLALLLLWGSLIVGGDQSTKQYALNNLKGTADAPLVYMGGTLVIQYAENPGAFLSLLAKGQDALRFWVLTVANGIVLGGLSLFLIGTRQTNRWVWTALVLILMGGIGNLIDRIRLDGIVVDFINLGIGSLRTGIFNVADIAITAGFIMLLPTVFFGETPADDNGTPTTKEGTPTPVASAVTSTTSSVSTSGTLASGQSPETGEIG